MNHSRLGLFPRNLEEIGLEVGLSVNSPEEVLQNRLAYVLSDIAGLEVIRGQKE